MFDVEFKVVDDSKSETELKFDKANIVKFGEKKEDVVSTDCFLSNGKVYILK